MGHFGKLAFTPAVKALQEKDGSRRVYERIATDAPDVLGEAERDFIGERDSFYMASVGETGWPYIQHRGGPKGFVRVLDERTIGFADFRGNRQHVTAGNVGAGGRVALIFMDYPHQARLKLLAHASIATDAATLARVAMPGVAADRAFVLRVEAFDWNCAQHITPRYSEAELLQRFGGG